MKKYKILKELIKFNTIKDKENTEIINYIESVLKGLNFRTEYKSKSLIMSIGKQPKLGFLGHTDTVEYIEEFKNPFELTLKEGKLYLVAHTHPDHGKIKPSADDYKFLRQIEQKKSLIVSYITGEEHEFSDDRYSDLWGGESCLV